MKLISVDKEKTLVEFNKEDRRRISNIFMMLNVETDVYDWAAAAVAGNTVTQDDHGRYYDLWLGLLEGDTAQVFLTGKKPA